MAPSSDVLIVGGGIAGAATAIHLARAGLKVEIFDRKQFPRDKPCGEGLMPHGVRMLTELGVMQRLNPDDRRHFKGIEYVIDGDTRARGVFPEIEGGYQLGVGVRRLKLDAVVLDMARAHPNVKVHENVRVDGVLLENGRAVGLKTRAGEIEGRLIIGADGRGSLVRNQLGLDAPPPKRQRYAVRAHFHFEDGARVGEYVEVYKNRVGELYTTPVGPHEMLAVMLMEKRDMDLFKGRLEQGYHEYFTRYPYLQARFEGATQCSDVMACGPMACASSRPYTDGAMLVGDAAGFLDPITGEGMSLALATAKAAAGIAVTALERGIPTAEALAAYGPERARITRHYYILTRALLFASQNMPVARFVVRRIAKTPGLFRTLLGVNCGHFRLRDLSLWDVGRFLVGI